MPNPSDQPLRDRVKLLGQLLGDTLRDQEGRAVLEAVETLRQGFIELRRQPEAAPDDREPLMRLIAALNPDMLNHVVRAFSAYFTLANIAEDPAVCLLADEYSEDWSGLWWVRVDGQAAVRDDDEALTEARAALGARYAQHVADPPEGPVIEVTVERWSGWTASSGS